MSSNFHTVAIVSDVHFDSHHPAAWANFKRWCKDVEPSEVHFLGDIIYGAAVSRYPKDKPNLSRVAKEIKFAAREINAVVAGKKVITFGNHEARWRKRLLGDNLDEFEGCYGLGLADQFYAQGLSRSTHFFIETANIPGYFLGSGNARTLLRHGHQQFPFGPKHLAATMLQKTPRVNQVIGHCHRGQIFCATSLGETRFAVANPCMQIPQDYAMDSDWQKGLTLLHFYGGKTVNECNKVTPQLIIMDSDGSFVEGGKLYA